MPSPAERSRNNVRTGIFVTVAIVLALATTVVLTGIGETLLRPVNSYQVAFDVGNGIKNLKAGAQVRVGGMLMGRVGDVRPQVGGGGPFETILVDFTVDRKVEIFSDAKIAIASQLIGSDAWLNIFSVGTLEMGQATEAIEGISAPGALTALLGPDMVDDASQIMANFRHTSEDVRDLADRVATDDWPRWAGSVDEVMTWATSATESIDSVLTEGENLFKEARGMVTENREGIRASVANIQDASADTKMVMSRVRAETLEKIHALLDNGQKGVDSAVAVLEELRNDYPLWAEDVTEALAAARLTGQQLKLTSIEVRRSPWKLLYQPSRGEVEHEMLYEAARSFAFAGSDLKASSSSARRLLDRHGDDLDEPTIVQINDFLQDSFKRYDKAQQRLVDVLISNPVK